MGSVNLFDSVLPWLQCVLTLCESSPAATDAIAATFCYCCWNNQSFSACAIEDLQVSGGGGGEGGGEGGREGGGGGGGREEGGREGRGREGGREGAMSCACLSVHMHAC